MKKKLNFDCVVIGGGAAGLAASVYLKRANLEVVIIEKSMPGGQMNFSAEIENYPGFKKIDGPSLSANMYEQIINLGIPFKNKEVISVEKNAEKFVVETVDEIFEAKNIIITTGRQKRLLGLPNEEKLVGKGVSYCAFCDGMFYKDKDVVVIGGGNTAVEEALHLSHIVKSIKVINRKDSFNAEKIMVDRLNEKDNVEVLYNSEIIEMVETDNKLSGVVVKNNKDNSETNLSVAGAFIFIGYVPNNDLFRNLGIELNRGYIKVKEDQSTNIEGVYAGGDCVDKEFYQIVNAVSEGAMAASAVIKKMSV